MDGQSQLQLIETAKNNMEKANFSYKEHSTKYAKTERDYRIALAKKIITTVAAIAPIQRVRLSIKTLCHSGKSARTFLVIDVAIETAPNQTNRGIKGK